jgi:hypothetical protein
MYPDFLDSLINVAREGGGLGLYLILTAGNAGSFMFRIAQYVKVSYALQLTDRADYRQLVGGNGRQEPGHSPGRGFTKGPLEFQTALCVAGASEGERVKQLRAICTAMSEAWKGSKPALIRTIPKEIDSDALSFDADRVQVGIEKRTALPYDFLFKEMNGCVISGEPGSGKTNTLGWLVRALSEDPDTSLYIYEKGSALESLCGASKVGHDGAAFDAFLSDLAEEYDRRSENSGNTSRIALCIDDFAKFYAEISDESAGVLDLIIRYGEEYGMYVYIAGDKDGLTRLHTFLVKPFESCLANGNAIALGGRLKGHSLFNPLHQEEDIALSGFEGCVIHGGQARYVRFAKIKVPEKLAKEVA